MNTLNALNAILASLTLVQELLPVIGQATQKGEVTPEQQAQLLAKLNSLKTQSEGQFTGDHWKVE